MDNSKRNFLKQTVAIGLTLPLAKIAFAAENVDEKSPQASALGYVSNTKNADNSKYPKHQASQQCSGCVLYQGKAGDKSGPCPLFQGKLVSANGWCGSFVAKA